MSSRSLGSPIVGAVGMVPSAAPLALPVALGGLGGIVVAEIGDEGRSGPRHAGPNGADLALAHLGRLGVGQPEHLGEHEGVAAIGREPLEEVVDLDATRLRRRPRPGDLSGSFGQSAPALLTSDPVGAGVAGDPQHPGARRRLGSERRESAQDADERVLGEVVGMVASDQARAELPHLGLGPTDEAPDRAWVTGAGIDGEAGEVVHAPSLAKPGEWNHLSVAGDYRIMRCETARDLISADLDGEADDDERRLVEGHRAACVACDHYAGEAARLHRAMRVAPAAPVPDLTDAILGRAAREGAAPVAASVAASRPPRLSPAAKVLALQYALLVVALTIAVLAVPQLLASSGPAVHTSRHLGGWDLAFGFGLVVAALQPWRARGLLPMALALGGVMAVTAAIDIAYGYTPGVAEASHLLELFGLVFLWLLSRTSLAGQRDGRPVAVPAGGLGSPMAAAPSRLRSLSARVAGPASRPAPAAGHHRAAAVEARRAA